MRHLKQPELWFLAALLLLTTVGAVLLTHTRAIEPESRHLAYNRHHWQVAFDALSAGSGVGMLTYDFQDDYTTAGRWILTGLGVLGAALFIAAATHIARRIRPADTHSQVPHPLLAVGVFLLVQAVTVGIFLLATWQNGGGQNAWRAIAAACSLGWGMEPSTGGVSAWPVALLAWIGALGWPIWLLPFGPPAKRFIQLRSALTLLGGYTAFLLLAALLICMFESPRGTTGSGGPSETLSSQNFETRYARSLIQVSAASGAGMPTEPLAERETGDGTKLALTALLLVGGLGGSATGGVQLALLLWALAGGLASIGWLGRGRIAPDVTRWMRAGLSGVLLMSMLILIIAVGLLLIENWTATRYQPPPSLADALLDAGSVVAGGNLTTGLTETVTGRNLVTGIHQSTSLYQYGMSWLMLAMLSGRILPLVIMRHLADWLDTGSARHH